MTKRSSGEMKFKGSSEGDDREDDRGGRRTHTRIEKSPPAHVKKPKLAFSIAKKSPLQKSKEETIPKPVKPSLREAFNSDTEEEEEMPIEAKRKMRNFGRDTPTSAGPNSFGKTKQGFCDAKKLFEKQLKAAAEELAD
ncbi:PEST proteolytic signal-containing nuclear [Nesidiocoris tenuis]|uniref:PEST proteolytic signal-containing nuclear protein n=1 Tax=Nesidiocoris tenuis TaxID=355587 RepID=A0ABN7ALX7_9HEMI|nr:PEST proteolytic signal-containing nuclear [Nesidiocoris tenuis]